MEQRNVDCLEGGASNRDVSCKAETMDHGSGTCTHPLSSACLDWVDVGYILLG